MAGISSTILAGLGCLVALGLSLQVSKWRRNYRIALSTGFPVFYSPIHISSVWWMMLYPVLMPILKLLPQSWTSPWLQIAQVWKIWKLGYEPFQEAGADTFILATPSGNMLWSSDNAIVRDLFTQHPYVDAPVEFLKFWNVWGPTIASVQGNEWKAHRRAVTAGFGPAMNRTVWEETQHQTETLAAHWIENDNAVIPVIRYWTSRLALHIICSGFFGLRIEWDNRTAAPLPPGHQIALDAALPKFIERLSVFFMVPQGLLGRLPWKKFRDTHLSFTETTKYLEEFRAQVLNNIEAVTAKTNKTILESIVLSGVTSKDPLPKESVLGDIFFTLLAGHETTGGTLGFTYLLMAIYPECQKRMQAELDDQLGRRPVNQWTLEKDYPVLRQGYVGAIQKEILYVFNPASFIMRKALAPVTLVDSHGGSHHIPENTLTLINNAGAARNPNNWDRPKVPAERSDTLSDSPALNVNPDRWLEEVDGDDNSSSKNRDLATWTAFGAGGRACPGKEFANIQLTSAMATLFKFYSLELVVEEKTRDECSGDEKLAWEKTRDKAIKMMYDDMEANITIGVYKDIPIRIVKRTWS
ncbi:Cytochrome P450 2J3 [Lachnellula arida]|uniref:Cytochrome P450 2J3 n=1 Tax=Lachnellula arida TaxID=1316785 RepID=A0A8T9B1Q5_9HELO|nr:Cytochrome P450 2J3 [Lachnellula arida]